MILLAEIQGFLTSLDIWDVCFILMLAIFLGIEVISNVPAILHTPLMSVTNAISGIIIIGGMLQISNDITAPMTVLGALALVWASFVYLGYQTGIHEADELTEGGYDLMLSRAIPQEDPNWLDRIVTSGMVDGVLMIGQSDQFDRIEDVADGYTPMVVWGNHTEGQRHCVVGTDNRLGGRLAAERLIAAGARRLAFLGDTGPMEFAARFAGAQDVATRMGLPPIIALPTHLSPDRASEEIARHLAAHAGSIDGIFAATDTLASLCLTELRAHGIAVPEGVTLVGFDDLPIARQTIPPLTTVRQDIAAGAHGLVDLLLRRLGMVVVAAAF